ncbi:uncharacterized protein LOC126316688 [Schistocerca gregaria]|uniref:uncharacterized protein LOC126316688 n=1 Tax=Schistocerca gregaria TaxID=7010 RepID=UPI00211ECC8A|nr:uncharacterized protein LOC126316688 [Schistocerca gregaria]
MGQEQSSGIKQAFQRLDTDHNGTLNLGDVLTIQAVGGVEHLIHNSPLLLYRFDKEGNGSINRQEFTKLLTYIKSKEKEIRSRRNGEQRKHSRVWSTISRETALEFQLSREEATPALTGNRPYCDDNAPALEDSEEYELALEILQDTVEYFNYIVRNPEGRNKFLNWLFRLADLDNTNRVSVTELAVMIQALRHDGINPEDLIYDSGSFLDAASAREGLENYDMILASQLLQEYDVDSKGYLTPREFHVLASLIVRNYESRNEDLELLFSDYHLEGYKFKRRLAKGSNGDVRLAVELKTGVWKAIKILPKGNVADLSRIDTEIKAMMMLKHPHVVSLEEVLEDDTHVFFVMEFCGGGNVSDYLGGRPISDELARFYFSQIVRSVQYCHERGVAHRDLKLDNILLDNDSNVKISDFGHAGIYRKGWDLFSTPLVGGLCHLAPEQIAGRPYPGEKHDVWSLGVILFILLSGTPPFKATNPVQLIDDIQHLRYQLRPGVHADAEGLIRQMLTLDPNMRPTVKEIARHPWLKGTMVTPILTRFNLLLPKRFWVKYKCTCESLCYVLKYLGIEPVFNPLTIKAVEDEHGVVRCHWPARGVKFSFKVERDSEDVEMLEFRLSSGASRDFLSLFPKLRWIVSNLGSKNYVHLCKSDSNILTEDKSLSVLEIVSYRKRDQRKKPFGVAEVSIYPYGGRGEEGAAGEMRRCVSDVKSDGLSRPAPQTDCRGGSAGEPSFDARSLKSSLSSREDARQQSSAPGSDSAEKECRRGGGAHHHHHHHHHRNGRRHRREFHSKDHSASPTEGRGSSSDSSVHKSYLKPKYRACEMEGEAVKEAVRYDDRHDWKSASSAASCQSDPGMRYSRRGEAAGGRDSSSVRSGGDEHVREMSRDGSKQDVLQSSKCRHRQG